MGVRTLEHDHKEIAMFQHSEDTLELQSAVNNQNTEYHLEI